MYRRTSYFAALSLTALLVVIAGCGSDNNNPSAVTLGCDLSDDVEVLDRRLHFMTNSVEFDLDPPEVL